MAILKNKNKIQIIEINDENAPKKFNILEEMLKITRILFSFHSFIPNIKSKMLINNLDKNIPKKSICQRS